MVRSLRSNSGATLALALTAVVLTTTAVPAHRLDECLQAARIAVEEDRVEIELGLTPGVAVADAIIGDIDGDRNGSLSGDEQRAYVGRVLDAVQLRVDGQLLPVAAMNASFPELAEFRRGDGTIRITLAVTIAQTPGSHRVFFRNDYRRDASVYLANALVPDSHRIDVTAQHRDGDQRELTIEYVVRPANAASVPWWLLGSMMGFTVGATFLGRTRLRQRVGARSIAADPQ
jgi:hypothetical protein